MLLGEPQPTQYDLHFSLLGIPVRVHPLFWLMGVILGASGGLGEDAGVTILIWIAVVFVSILVHEFGHALTMRHFGQRPRVLLYLMGGLAIPDSSPWEATSKGSQNPRDRILVLAAGPGAGFLLAGLVAALVFAGGGAVRVELTDNNIPWYAVELDRGVPLFESVTDVVEYEEEGVTFTKRVPNDRRFLLILISSMLFVNIFWGLMNLLPVYPLDGGQIAREVMTLKNPWDGIRRSLMLSLMTSAVVAVIGLLLLESVFMAFLFGSLAFSSWQALQQISGRGGGFGGGGGRPW